MTDPHDHLPDELLLRYLDRELDPELAREFEAHVSACAECGARLDALRAVSLAIDDYGAATRDRRADGGQREALAAALERNGRARRAAPLLSLGALAAALILVLVLRPGNGLRRDAGPVRNGGRDLTPFIALPYSDENLSQEGAVVLQVEVPRSALLLAGIPGAEGGSGGRVKAEVVVGADGLARAIRFLN